MKVTSRFGTAVVAGLVAAAVAQQLGRPAGERDWHGRVGGIVPYDFRPPTVRRLRRAWFNPDDPRLFTERDFGVGWALNLGALQRRLQRA